MPQLLVSWATAGGCGAGRWKALGGWGKGLPLAFPPILTMLLGSHTWTIAIGLKWKGGLLWPKGCGGVQGGN